MTSLHIKELKSHRVYKIDLSSTLITKVATSNSTCFIQSRHLSELLNIRDFFKSADLTEHGNINVLKLNNVKIKILNFSE